MFRKLLVIAAVVAISFFCLSGCKKSPGGAEPEQEVKTMAEYEAEAREQINKENMDKELKSIEKQLEQELSQEQ